MCGWIETLVFAVFGILGLVKGEFKITRNRKVKGSIGRVLGGLLLIAAAVPLFTPVDYSLYGALIRWGLLVVVIVIGLTTSEKIGESEGETTTPES
ncbi:MAG: hypothetical protein WBB69_09015 [Anaerolineales bacterium]